MHSQTTPLSVVLESCVTALQESGESVDACLARHPNQRDELEPLLHLVVLLQSARTIRAPEEFRSRSASRVQDVIAARPRSIEQETRRPSIFELSLIRRLWETWKSVFRVRKPSPAALLISLVVAIALTGLGTAYASADALPGGVLYPVKTTIEDARLSFSLTGAKRAELRLAFAVRRLDEAAALLDKSRPEHVEEVLRDYEGQLASIVAILEDDGDLPRDERLSVADRMAIGLSRWHETRLNALLDQVEPSERPAVGRAFQAYRAALDRALDVAGGQSDRDPPRPFPTATRDPTPAPSSSSVPSTLTPSPERSRATSSPKPSISAPSPTGPEWPTRVRTPVPTAWPPAMPTYRPKRLPDVWPTGLPDAWPTGVPTAWPTGVPDAWPTGVPTAWPTGVPDAWSNGVPTAWPTRVSDAWSTGVPDTWPTDVPTAWPTPKPWSTRPGG